VTKRDLSVALELAGIGERGEIHVQPDISYSVPSNVHISANGEVLEWSGPMRRIDSRSAFQSLESFLALADARTPPDSIAEFAKRFGVLHVCEHQVQGYEGYRWHSGLGRCEACDRTLEDYFRQRLSRAGLSNLDPSIWTESARGLLDLQVMVWPSLLLSREEGKDFDAAYTSAVPQEWRMRREPIAAWRAYARELVALLRLAAHYRRHRSSPYVPVPMLEDLAILDQLQGPLATSGDRKPSPMSCAIAIDRLATEWLNGLGEQPCDVSISMVWPKFSDVSLMVKGLTGAIGLQLAAIASGGRELPFFCSYRECQKAYFKRQNGQRSPSLTKPHYCCDECWRAAWNERRRERYASPRAKRMQKRRQS
jgi:hypothetical protein